MSNYMILPGFLKLMNGNIYYNEYELGSNHEEENFLMDTSMCSNECSENIETIIERQKVSSISASCLKILSSWKV